MKGRDGLTGELAEIFGRYPTIGQNDGIYEEFSATSGGVRYETPEALVEALRKDRANYDAWTQGRDAEAEHYRLLQEQEEAEAAERWEQSGMSVMDYIRSRVEEGDPEFDLDWETAREMEHDRAMGRFQARAMIDGKETAITEGYPLSIREARNPDKVLPILGGIVGRSAAQIGELKLTRITEESLDHLLNSPSSQYQKSANSKAGKKLWRGTVAGMSVVDDIVATSNLGKQELPKHLNREWKKKAKFYTADTRFAVELEDGKYEVYPCKLIVSEINGERIVYDLTEIGEPTLTASGSLKNVPLAPGVNATAGTPGSTRTAVSANPVPNNIPKSGDAVNGLAKMSYAQPSLFDQVYQQTFDFNRQAEPAKQQERDLSSENAKPLIRTDKIEDVGEKISGARKDILKNYVAAIDDATREQLYALPFSKAFKRPDLVKAVQNGTMREQDANFYETILSTIVQKKPILTAKDARMKKYRPDYETNLDKWVDNTQNALSILKQFLGLDEAGRDQFIRTVLGHPQEPAPRKLPFP